MDSAQRVFKAAQPNQSFGAVVMPWPHFFIGYGLTVLLEAPVLLLGLSARHSLRVRLFACLWLTACTYPVVFFVLPAAVDPTASRLVYLALAEAFAVVAECALFWAAFRAGADGRVSSTRRDLAAVAAANLVSFAVGEALNRAGWLFPA